MQNRVVIQEKTGQTLQHHKMITPGDRVLVAVSGGADSVVLLNILRDLKTELNFDIAVAHFDHQMREDSRADAQFVSELAQSMNLVCILGTENVPEFIKTNKRSPEEAARELRYQFLRETAVEQNCNVVALGHHLDDRAETFLINLLRGSGLEGLSGMPAVRRENGLRFVRPLIDCTGDQIRQYASAHKIEFREDPTNSELIYTRNRVRQHLIPLMQDFNPNLSQVLARTSDLLSETHEFVEKLALCAYEELLKSSDDEAVVLDRWKFLAQDSFLAKHVLRRAVQELKGDLKGLESVHVDRAVEEIEKSHSGIEVPLMGSFKLFIDADEICITSDRQTSTITKSYHIELDPTEREPQVLDEIGWGFLFKCVDQIEEFSHNPLEAAFDFDKIVGPLTVRNRKPGDRLIPLGMGGRKKIQDLLVDAKIPNRERDQVPILCDQEGILWVVGIRMSERCRVTPQTERVLLVRAFRAEEE